MSDLVAFLKARLDEDEQAAQGATPGPWHALDGGVVNDDEDQWPVSQTESDRDREDRVHIARHDPARVLAEVAAKRQIIEDFTHWQPHDPGFDALELAVQMLALPFATHPDYDEAWRP